MPFKPLPQFPMAGAPPKAVRLKPKPSSIAKESTAPVRARAPQRKSMPTGAGPVRAGGGRELAPPGDDDLSVGDDVDEDGGAGAAFKPGRRAARMHETMSQPARPEITGAFAGGETLSLSAGREMSGASERRSAGGSGTGPWGSSPLAGAARRAAGDGRGGDLEPCLRPCAGPGHARRPLQGRRPEVREVLAAAAGAGDADCHVPSGGGLGVQGRLRAVAFSSSRPVVASAGPVAPGAKAADGGQAGQPFSLLEDRARSSSSSRAGALPRPRAASAAAVSFKGRRRGLRRPRVQAGGRVPAARDVGIDRQRGGRSRRGAPARGLDRAEGRPVLQGDGDAPGRLPRAGQPLAREPVCWLLLRRVGGRQGAVGLDCAPAALASPPQGASRRGLWAARFPRVVFPSSAGRLAFGAGLFYGYLV